MIEDQFPNAVVHSYYLCNSKYCTDISANETTRLKGKKKFLHTWVQTQCERNKDEETFIQVARTRLKLQSIKSKQ